MATATAPTSDLVRLTDRIRDYYAGLKALPGFHERLPQKQMEWAIAQTLVERPEGTRHIAVEAATGVGKTLAYLLGAVSAAEILDKQVVISTATTALQAQLAERDVPAFCEATGIQLDVRVAKGRGRYMCAHNVSQLLGHASGQEALDFGSDHADAGVWPFQPSPAQVQSVTALEARLHDEAFDGDLDHLDTALDPSLVPLVTTSRAQCLGNACPHRGDCAFFKARQGLRKARLVIANHDLVLADLAQSGREGRILPAPEDALWIFDEAHHLPDKGLNRFAAALTLESATRNLKATERTLELVQRHLTLDPRGVESLAEVRHTLRELGTLFNELSRPARTLLAGAPRSFRTPDVAWHRFAEGVVPSELRALAEKGGIPAHDGRRAVERLRDAALAAMRDGALAKPVGERLVPALGENVDHLAGWEQVFTAFATPDEPGQAPTARWLEQRQRGNDVETTFYASPVTCGDRLAALLWKPMHGVVLTSATLTGLGNFNRFAAAAGLPRHTRLLRLGSPFDLERQATLVVPDMPDPKDAVNHTAAVSAYLPDTIQIDEATLVLFASRRQMREVHEDLPDALAKRALMQGDYPRDEILRRHAASVDAGNPGIIFGLASFAEGIDLPGDLCRHVIIAKLPFAVPDTPVEATLAEWLKSKGRNPFFEIALPDVSLKLTQWCGRLVRSETDTGRITILDMRLRTRPFGRRLLDTLPPFRRAK
jgi:ATP-dependent DNA helicase DinG